MINVWWIVSFFTVSTLEEICPGQIFLTLSEYCKLVVTQLGEVVDIRGVWVSKLYAPVMRIGIENGKESFKTIPKN